MESLLREFRNSSRETEWVEFKENKAEPDEIGEYISALSNSSALHGKAAGFLIWGVADEDHAVVGTTFRPRVAKVGNEDLENWLLRQTSPKIHFQFRELVIDGKAVVFLEIERAIAHPVSFRQQEFIRVGSYKKKLKDHPEKERALWRVFEAAPFERNIAAEHLTESEVLDLLDHAAYLELLKKSPMTNSRLILADLEADLVIRSNGAGRWDITNLGAVLFARRLETFPQLSRKAVRVIQYRGNSRIQTMKEQVGARGYGSGFDRLISYVNGLLPSNEVVNQALRVETAMYPELAVRELIANALIHQDFAVTGAGPMVEIFEDRIEVTNPGDPLVKAERFIDSPPRSRNEDLASLMRRLGICEERGSGWDKIVFLTELNQLPAPLTEVTEGSTRVVLFAHKTLNRMDRNDRVRAVYLHSCLRFVNREHTTNSSVRARFGIQPQNTAIASRLIKDALEEGLIAAYDQTAAPKLMRYVPFWASADSENAK